MYEELSSFEADYLIEDYGPGCEPERKTLDERLYEEEEHEKCGLLPQTPSEPLLEEPAPVTLVAHEPNPKTPLRLLYAGPCFRIGGVEQHALSLAKFLNPKRVRLVGCLVTNADKLQRPSALSVPVRHCSPQELSRAARDCDVLLIWGDAFNERLTPARPLCVYVAHGESWWTKKALLGSKSVIDHVIAVSQRVERRVCGGFPTTTILNGVDSSRLGQTQSTEALRRRLGFAPGDFILGSVGRFTKEKRMDLLIEAVGLLPPTFKLLLVGYGPRRAELVDLSNARIPGRYAFVEVQDFLGDYYGAMDAFCLASAHEGFGLVIPEAMLCQRPVVATNVGCVPEVLRHRLSGLVVDGAAKAFAEAAALLHSHPHWARGMALEGQAFANRHLHAARMAQDYENLLLRLFRQRSVAAREGAR